MSTTGENPQDRLDDGPGSADDALSSAYQELRKLAHFEARRKRNVAYRPTALLHETYLRLRSQRTAGWEDRRSFLAIAAKVMRRVLVDAARKSQRLKHGDGQISIDVEQLRVAVQDRAFDVLEVHDVLEHLSQESPEEARVAEQIVFGGLTIQEVGHAMGVSKRTVDRRWRFARAWLARELTSPRNAPRAEGEAQDTG